MEMPFYLCRENGSWERREDRRDPPRGRRGARSPQTPLGLRFGARDQSSPFASPIRCKPEEEDGEGGEEQLGDVGKLEGPWVWGSPCLPWPSPSLLGAAGPRLPAITAFPGAARGLMQPVPAGGWLPPRRKLC